MRRGIHTKPNRGLSDEWLTPPAIVRALGPFDLDPCAHPEQFYRTAREMIAPPSDGLAVSWVGRRVWLNPPFSETHLWLPKLVSETRGIALTAARTEVERWFWPYVWEAASAVLFLRGRLYFHRPDGSLNGNAGHGSCLAAYSGRDVDALRRSGLRGRLVLN